MVLNTIQVLRRLILSDRNSGGLSPLEYAARHSRYRYLTMLMEEEGLLKKTVAFISPHNCCVHSNIFGDIGSPADQDKLEPLRKKKGD